MADKFDVGNLIRVYARFRNADGALTDPTIIVGKYQTPAGVETTYTYGSDAQLVKLSTGVYYFDISVTAAGVWYYRFNGSGTIQAAAEGNFTANATQF